MTKTILVVEDEFSIATLLKYNLEQAGYLVETAADGLEGLNRAMEIQPDLILLDLMLPKLDGMEVCKQIRQQRMNTPIIMLTAKDDEFDKVLGLELGADDYMTKPFSPREVLARVKAVLRRFTQNVVIEDKDASQEKMYEFGQLRVFPERFEVFLQEEALEFTPKEFELLIYLLENKNRVLTRDQLLSAVWKYDFAGDTRIVDVHISHLRDKIEENSRKPMFIKTIRGLGYKFEEPKTS
ncbi:response regulator transcription factor [Lysinibacillus sphaericus]|uniref:Alkaline phosphatase synthesis transcriptional regulatory protein PhoP n=4 Tax=Lysinibacillus TaxID=400634 RepID=A0A2S5CX32_LYSSH|nr:MULTISPECIES: response regulator transcription factor [Lysinibacillus]AHN22880.1 PhoP family transcriptional regulator [Lysinibacillus varians]AVK95909.1 DNA-binding response regulator [Lysinibacillus sphaericus]MCS1380686.1 response regulator transcription factor [Lysinibacillus sphaericus]MED4544987.1 response regulator transcription factor [Lysinibacillus sphaericus]OEC00205.1 chemotaxis protein CheY [Lysinibacillus sphaericus]